MNEQWQELKETIIEMRDNDGTGTQQEVCKFLANYMEILEKQMQEQSTKTDVVALDFSDDIDTPNKYQTADGKWHEGRIPTTKND